ncbi:hypothetical protein OSU_1495 [Vibrio cholerae PS15]|nr:hypothetical protein OSU_1495 [Vibrio cholerae PS15]
MNAKILFLLDVQQCWLHKLVPDTFVTYFAAYLQLQGVWGSSLQV